MGCRCSDISKLDREIQDLNSALSCALRAADNSEETKSYMLEAGSNFQAGLTLAMSHLEIGDKLKKSYDNSIGYINTSCIEIQRAISEAKSELSSAKSEDKSYHERKRYKHND